MLPLAILLVSTLSVQEVLVETRLVEDSENNSAKPSKNIQQIRREWCGQGATLALGDPMVLLSAFCISEKSFGADNICSQIGLRPKALKEIHKLRRQLCSEMEAIIPEASLLLKLGLSPPNQSEARLFQQLLVASCGDNVASKMVAGEPGYVKGGYRCGQIEQPVFIHSSSVLKKLNPEWIIFQEIFEAGGKLLMRGITQIDPRWLPKFMPSLCNLGKVLEEPEPRYCKDTGTVRASFDSTYGPRGLPLPTVEMEYPGNTVEKYKIFSRFILEGEVCPALKKFSSSLLSSPAIMTKSWSNLQPRTQKFYIQLKLNAIENGTQLKQKFASDSNFLLNVYLLWVPETLHPDIKSIWPPEVDI